MENSNHISQPNSKRLDFLDIAKGIGIILVVLGHTYRGNGLNIFIYSFHMPLFFFISGLLYNQKKYATTFFFLKNKIRTLLLPYASFYILSYFYWLFVEKTLRQGTDVYFTVPIIGFFYGTDFALYMYPNGALWFLTCLFTTELLLFFILKFIRSNKLRLAMFIFCGLIGYFLSIKNYPPLPLSANTSFIAIVFVGVGFLSKDFFIPRIMQISKNRCLLISLFIFTVVYLLAPINGQIDMDYSKYQNPVIFTILALIGILACLLLASYINYNKILQFFGINSLIVMGLSELVKRAVIGLVSKFTNLPILFLRQSLLYSLICVFIILLFFVPIIYMLNKYLYLFLGKRKLI